MNKIRALIWGAGKKTAATLCNEELFKNLDVVGVADNNESKIGKDYHGYTVWGIKDVIERKDCFDCIIISVEKFKDIHEQLTKAIDVPIYTGADELLCRRCSIDISSRCNAKCSYCYTGRKNNGGFEADPKDDLTLDEFKRIHRHLISSGLIFPFNEIMLYSWGEPFVNRDYLKIIDYLADSDQVFSISTNGSVLKLSQNPKAYEKCKVAVFSLSGMSQEAYGRIHGFKIDVIKENIKRLVKNMRECGFKGKAVLSFHVYKFNRSEVSEAEDFSKEAGLEFKPVPAYLASWSLLRGYYNNSISRQQRIDIDDNLFMDIYSDILKNRPKDFRCQLENIISINSNGKLELCCCTDQDTPLYFWKNITDISGQNEWRGYRTEMMGSDTCRECRQLGIDYLITGEAGEYFEHRK